MQQTMRIAVGPYSIALVACLLLYWNASLIFSRSLTAFLATLLAVKLDLAFHLLYACMHHVVAVAFRLRTVMDPQDVLNHFQVHSQLYVVADIASIALLVGNTLQYWSAALITRIALSALVARAEAWMRWWESQSIVEHILTAVSCLACMVGCALQWAYYVLLPKEEVERGGFASLLMWYTSTVYIVAVGVRATCVLTTALMRMFGYRMLQCLAYKVDRVAARTLEESGLNPFAEVHELYMAYLYALVCAATAWYYAPPLLPMWMQCFVLLRIYLIASASGKLVRYKQVLNRFPSVLADSSKACAICRDDFLDGEHVTCLPCGHTFHGGCVRSWLVRVATCPTCRHPVAERSWRREQLRPRGATRGVTGRHFTGSVQPLAPRHHVTPSLRQQRSARQHRSSGPSTPLRPRSSRGGGGTVAARAVPHITPLPYMVELQRLEAERHALAQHRLQFLSHSSFPAASPVTAPPPLANSVVAGTETGSDGDGGVDPFLFTDTPLASMEATAEGRQDSSSHEAALRRHKRRRDQTTITVSATEDERDVYDESFLRRRTE